jgi:hypothetical protein
MGNSQEDVLRWDFDGVEVYNHVCQWLNGKGDGVTYWNMMLGRRPGTLALAVDDAHVRAEHPGWNGGWVVVNAEQRSPAAILAALRQGRFYASCGPQFLSLECNAAQVHIRTSPVQFARLVGPAWCGRRQGSFTGRTLTDITFDIPGDWSYAYLEIEDAQGRRAWTNPLPRLQTQNTRAVAGRPGRVRAGARRWQDGRAGFSGIIVSARLTQESFRR